MKKLLTVLLILGVAGLGLAASAATPAQPLKGKISISGAWALYPMVQKWVEEFTKAYPEVKIDVQAGGAGKGIADTLAGMVDIGMVSRDVHPAEVDKGALALAVTKDAVVATINARNPRLKDILERGAKREALVGLWVSDAVKTWGQVIGTADKSEVQVFTRSDACGAAETWAAYLGKRQEDLQGVGVYGDPGVADAVRRDPMSIGFNNVNFAYDPTSKKPVEGLAILPLDLDGNGRVDPGENFYATRDQICAAIAAGKYPSPPARDLYLVTKGVPSSEAVKAFLRWVLTKGQAFVADTGYISLSPEKLKKGLTLLGEK
jgi:phosphate transport system substrate-binding protein